MERDSPRLLLAGPTRRRLRPATVLALMFLLPIIAPMTTVSAQLQFRADDFGILSKLDEVLDEREARIDDISVITEANQALDQVRLEVRESDAGDPLSRLDDALDDAGFQIARIGFKEGPQAAQHLFHGLVELGLIGVALLEALQKNVDGWRHGAHQNCFL